MLDELQLYLSIYCFLMTHFFCFFCLCYVLMNDVFVKTLSYFEKLNFNEPSASDAFM